MVARGSYSLDRLLGRWETGTHTQPLPCPSESPAAAAPPLIRPLRPPLPPSTRRHRGRGRHGSARARRAALGPKRISRTATVGPRGRRLADLLELVMLKIQVGVTYGEPSGAKKEKAEWERGAGGVGEGAGSVGEGHRHGLEGRRCVQRIGG
ncbi:hypothetical protein PVAP13_1NG396919 [Panicum virgatum]|uniref:Uncharacterized protein n=1 Tax=Panicum virgatum TaxID=38727 RepID=A0A8T0X6G6_PANVG|nr:hypothetical protein PVAP13_1NG396919 [Panicum virgatum]